MQTTKKSIITYHTDHKPTTNFTTRTPTIKQINHPRPLPVELLAFQQSAHNTANKTQIQTPDDSVQETKERHHTTPNSHPGR